MSKRKLVVLFLLVIANISYGQKKADTTALIKKFNKVMSFVIKPYLFYTSTTTINSKPTIPNFSNNTVLHSTFYKVNNDVYYGNEQEEVYLEDSLMINIDHSHKQIRISKVDVASKERMNAMPLQKMDVQKMLSKHYVISEPRSSNDSQHIIITSNGSASAQPTTQTEMEVGYTNGNSLPYSMQVTMNIQQPASDELIAMLNNQGLEVRKMTVERDGSRYIAMSQTATIYFEHFDTSKEKAQQIPTWNDKIEFADAEKTFKGKGTYESYEVIKTF